MTRPDRPPLFLPCPTAPTPVRTHGPRPAERPLLLEIRTGLRAGKGGGDVAMETLTLACEGLRDS